MKIILLILIIPLVISAPYLRRKQTKEDEENDKETLIYAKLSSDIDLAWEVQSNSLTLAFKLPSQYYWLVLGFHTIDKKEITSFDQAIFFRVRDNSLSVKSADWSFEDGFLASEEQVWEEESENRLKSSYQVTVSRPVGGFDTRRPLKLVYGYGADRRFKNINSVFKTSFKKKFIDLLKPGHFLREKRLTLNTTVTTEIDQTSANTTHMTQTKKPTEETSTTTREMPVVVKTTKESKPMIERLKHRTNKPSLKTTLSTLKKQENETPITKNVTENVKRSPCPATCNCSSHTTTKDSHWYDVVRAKENSTYFAIIGTAALLTALIVLLIACCCATASKPLRSRKQKVTFYNVDDFDSADDEEIDLIDNEKQHT